MVVDEEIILALKRSRLTVAKMQARQQLLQNQLEDIKTDTELLLGPFGNEAERFIEAGETLHTNNQEIVDSIASWNADLQLLVDSMLGEPDAELHKSVSKFMRWSAKFEATSLEEMTETVRLITQTRTDLRRAAEGE